MTKITSNDVRAGLVLRYPAQSHALMFEVAPRTGGGTRYADAVSVGLWSSHGHKVEGFEIKVSRSDFLSEMKQPEKSAPVFEYCNHWWLACPKGMVKPDEVPATWGLLELQEDGCLRVKKAAPVLEPRPLTTAFFAAMIRRTEPHGEIIESLLRRAEKVQYAQLEERFKSKHMDKLSYEQSRALEAIQHLKEIKEKHGIDFMTHHYDDRWFKAVDLAKDLQSNYSRGSLSILVERLTSTVKSIQDSGLLKDSDGSS